MKFIMDEQLPNTHVKWLAEQGYDAKHATSLGTGIKISDVDICKESMAHKSVVITKDADFFNSFLLKKEPWKLVYVTTGNITNKNLLSLFESNFSNIVALLDRTNVIEMDIKHVLIRV